MALLYSFYRKVSYIFHHLSLSVHLLMKAIFNLESAELSQILIPRSAQSTHEIQSAFSIGLSVLSSAEPYGSGERALIVRVATLVVSCGCPSLATAVCTLLTSQVNSS